MKTSAKPNLILGTATGYRPEQLRIFVESARENAPTAHVAVLVNRGNDALCRYLTSRGVEPLLISTEPRWMPGPLRRRRFNHGRIRIFMRAIGAVGRVPFGDLRRRAQWAVAPAFHHVSNGRYWFYLRYLLRSGRRFERVLLADTRDVVFQADPFEKTPASFLWLFTENVQRAIRDDPYNTAWVRDIYGDEGFAAIAARNVVCSGTTLGSRECIIDYLRCMVDEVARLTAKIANYAGFDQGIHNHLFYSGLLPAAQLRSNFHGPVATLSLEDAAGFRLDERGRLLNSDDAVVPVVHQYDRHPSMVACYNSWFGTDRCVVAHD